MASKKSRIESGELVECQECEGAFNPADLSGGVCLNCRYPDDSCPTCGGFGVSRDGDGPCDDCDGTGLV